MRKSLVGAILCVMVTYNASASIISRGFFDEAMENYATNTALDLKANQTDLTALSNKIGDLPSAILPGLWTAIPYYSENNVNMPEAGIPLPPTLGEQLEFLFNGGPESPIERMFWTITMRGGNIETNDNPDTYFLGLNPLTQKIRSIQENITLPSGDIVGYGPPVVEMLQHNFYQYPKDLAGIYGVLFGTEENIGVLERFATSTLFGVPNSFSGLSSIGIVPDGKNLVGMISETDAKIGTLPSGNFPDFPEYENFFSSLRQPLTYPTSLKELITAIYGNYETFTRGLLDGIISGFRYDSDGDGSPDAPIGLIPNFMLANANATKIGDLPTEYATVGAALTAMDAKITAKNLPSTSDDGQYVLTAKKVGETVTYTWVKMDLTNEEQIQ